MAAPTQHPLPGQPQLTYTDRVEVSETFANSLRRLTVDGGNVHLELVVYRMDDAEPPKPMTGHAITSARLVMPLMGVIDLHAHLSRLLQSLQAQGVIQPISPGPQSVN